MNSRIHLWAGVLLFCGGIARAADEGFALDGSPLPSFSTLPSGVAIRTEADSWEELIGKVKPTITWNGRDMLWVRGIGQNIQFTIDRAYGHDLSNGREKWALLNPGDVTGNGELGGMYVRETIGLGKNRHTDAGTWAIVVSTSSQHGTLYEIGWETAIPEGSSHWVEGRRIFILHDRPGIWSFAGEGPGDAHGRGSASGFFVTTQDYHVHWNRSEAEPVTIRVTTKVTERTDRTDDREPDLCKYRDGVLAGPLPMRIKWSEGEYTFAAGDTLVDVARRVTIYQDDDSSKQATRDAHVANMTTALRKLNAASPSRPLAEGARIELPSAEEFLRIVRRSSAPADDAEASTR